MEPADVTREHLDAETDRVVATAAAFRNDAILAPSLCEGWSRGHVLSHLARNADALSRVCEAVLHGTDATMYDSDEARDADIAAGARRCAADLAEDVRTSAERLAPLLARIGHERAGMTFARTAGASPVPVERLPYMRLRELVFHHVDLDAGYGFGHLSPELARLFLTETVARLRSDPAAPALTVRTDEGETHTIGDGTASVTGSRAGVLLWLTRSRGGGVRCDGPLPDLPSAG